MAYMTCVAYIDFFIIFILFYFILLQVFYIIFLGFRVWGNGPPSILKENQQNFEKKKRFCFLEGYHIYYFHGGIGRKKEGMHYIKKEREKRDFPRADLGSSLGEDWYIYMREEEKMNFLEDSLMVKGRERGCQGKRKEAWKRPVGKIWEYKNQWRFSHRKEVFPGMFTVDPFLIPIILLMYEFLLDSESRLDARG